MLQYFNTNWNEIAQKMPELAEAGYDSLWLPPPTKGSGGLSVGYDLWDRFDLGSKDQRGSIRTRYGTEAELLRLIETAHRFGIRIYLDNVMNHNAFDVPGYSASTPIDLYPGFVPEDFHLKLTQDGFYRKWDNIRDYNDAWQVQHLGLADLIDIAQEPGTTNENFGATEGSTFPKIKFVRQPNNPEYYCFKPDGTYVGFGPGNGITTQMLADNPGFYSEYVEQFLNRSVRWEMDRTKADGLRLDAVKHVRGDFFGAGFGSDKDTNDYGYLGQAQRQFNLTRGFNNAKFNTPGTGDGFNVNLRESLFDTEKPRHNAMMFGEHLGEPPPYSDYFNVGMRLVDNVLRNNLNGILGNPSATLTGLDQSGSYGFAASLAVAHAQSHDNDYYTDRDLQHGLYLTRAGIGLIYTDGNHQAQTLGQSGGAFPRHANSNFLGQFTDPKIPNLLYIHNQFARGYQVGRFADNDFVAYERIDKRENATMSDADGTTLLYLMNDNSAAGQSRSGWNISFAHIAGGSDSYLYNYSTYGGGFYTYASSIVNGGVIVPPGGYFAFSWRNPEESKLWSLGGGKPVTILQAGLPTSSLTYLRKDGPDGDPNFNPYGVLGAVPGSYSYPYTIPRVTNATALTFIARADGSAENILFALDGGVDLNGTGDSNDPIGKRDHPPGLSTDVFLGYEQPTFIEREGPEKFAAIDTARCTFGSAGAETYTVGAATVNGSGANPQDAAAATFVFHDPTGGFGTWGGVHPATQLVDNGSTLQVFAKTNGVGSGFRMFLYFTNDGSNPEGAGGTGLGTTQVAELLYQSPNESNGDNWWANRAAPRPAGTIKYKLGIYKTLQSSQFPSGATEAGRKVNMLTTFATAPINATIATIFPHADFGATQTGLSEGFHIIRARAFLNRAGRASIYNTFQQTFYYDAQAPQGEIKFPAENDTIGGSGYGVVVRTDPSVTEVWYHLDDADASNNDANTRTQGGNGNGFEPFTDTNNNGTRDNGEPFEDLNANGVWDSNLATTWARATEVTPSLTIASAYPKEWRFNYNNIPSGSTAAHIQVRLRELSSAEFKDFSLGDSAGHYTTLIRNVTANGPAQKMFVAFPPTDGTVVDSSYVMKVWFSKSLADGTTTAELISRFLIKLASSESGSPANGVAQDRAGYSINYNVTSDYDELAFTLPNLYNDLPDFLHTIDVTYTPPVGGVPLEAFRLVKAKPVTVIKDNIVTPPAVDPDGQLYIISLPDVANPTADQRAVPIRVETDQAATNVVITFTQGTGSVTLNSGSPTIVGTSQFWDFTWNSVTAGNFTFIATATTPSGNATASRNATIVFRQVVTDDPAKQDKDDDGLGLYGPTAAPIETTAIPLPTTNSETWVNGDVHIWVLSGKTNPLSPDTDGDVLSDGLESGWATAVGDTDTTTDTNGDGVKNFQPDLDPPIYNTTDNANRPTGYEYFTQWPYNLNNSRTDQLAGSMTDPTRADTDGDALNDGFEDRTFQLGGTTYPILPVYNGRVDIGVPDSGGILRVIAHPPTVYNTSRVDRAKVLAVAPSAVWLETDPNNADTDSDGVIDGNEDANHNGIVDLAVIDRNQTDANGNFVVLATFNDFTQIFTVTGSAPGSTAQTFKYSDFCATYVEPTNSLTYTSAALDKAKLDAIFRPGGAVRADKLDVVWLETDPRRYSTSGDALPDGWKLQHNLDPFDDGIVGHYNLRTGQAITTTTNGVNGDPDGDGLTNLEEFLNGTDPQQAGTPPPPPPGAITIGPGATTTFGLAVNKHEFTDWGSNDLIALDAYDGDGGNFNQGDVYHGYDGFDSSRDMVAFYAHDGGDTTTGGDGNFYFRVDMADLQAYAEQGHLDIYVAINLGNPGTGEYNLPDQVDTGTSLKWQVVVAAYQTDKGNVYVWDKNHATHSTAIGQDLSQFGVTTRDQNSTNGFKKAYYNSDLDAVEFSISRQALKDAGWNEDPSTLLYQVFTTRDGTQNSPQGAGDIGGRSDIRDSIRNDGIASDYYRDQPNISGANSVLNNYIGINADNDLGKRVKVVSLIHGNQAIQPGSVMQKLINNGASGGYYRALDAHQAFDVPLTLHVTPTFASAVQWARSASLGADDGPAFNSRIGAMIGNGAIDLLGSTFSDHLLPYFDDAFNADNLGLARDFLSNIYGHLPSPDVLWTPERVSSSAVLQKIATAGYGYSFVDQMRHLTKWFGRTSALGDDGYRINQINGENVFVINDSASSYLFQSDDNGSPVLSRQLLSRKARAATQDQVVIFMNSWEDFTNSTNATNYDKNLRWLGSRPWIQLVTPDQIVNGETGTAFGVLNRGTGLSLGNVAKDYVDHATEENYDNWYNGSGLEESLRDKKFNIRTGVPLTTTYGTQGVSGLANSAWQAIAGITPGPATVGLDTLARAALHASVFETAFHDQTNNDLSKYSTGAYINPDTGFQSLAGFAKAAQAHTRDAAIFARVNTWSQAAAAGSYNSSSVAEQADVDLDGENEYLIYNDRLFTIFERLGGRMTAAWLRDINTGVVTQVAGNLSSYAGSESEEEGTTNTSLGAVVAYRTSSFKDWFAKIDNTTGSGVSYTNNLYSVVPAASGIGWKFTSSDGKIVKTITLPVGKGQLTANYTLTGYVQLFVRFGLAPDLLDLLQNGQKYLGSLTSDPQDVNLFNTNPNRQVRAYLRFNAPGFSGASYNSAATDRDADAIFDTVVMRNQAQTQQVEMQGASGMTFAIGFETGATLSYDTDGDGLPDSFENQYGLNPNDPNGNNGASGDQDGDGLTNRQEYILGTNPVVADAASASLAINRTSPTTVALTFPSVRDRVYKVSYTSSLTNPTWTQAGANLTGTGSPIIYTDDGSDTGSPPTTSTPRFYRLDVSLVP